MRQPILFLLMLVLIAGVTPAEAKSVIKIGRNIDIAEDQQVDNAVAVGGQITISGLVDDHVVAVAGSVVLTSEAIVRGNVVSIGGVVVQGNGAQVYGRITEINSSTFWAVVASAFDDETQEWSWLTDIIYFCFLVLLVSLSLLTAFLFPGALNAIMFSIQRHKAKSFFWGVLGMLMIAPFLMLLVLSFVGIPFIPIVFSLILLACMFGFIAVSALLGRWVLAKSFRHHQNSPVRETLLGLLLWWVAGRAPFYTGWMIQAAFMAIGFGGVLLAVLNRGGQGQKPAA